MNKKLIFKYFLLYVPFVVGIGLFSFGIFNLFSSLLFFVGGYMAIKNTFDYRKVKKNVESIQIEDNSKKKEDYTDKSIENITNFKRVKKYSRVRKKIK